MQTSNVSSDTGLLKMMKISSVNGDNCKADASMSISEECKSETPKESVETKSSVGDVFKERITSFRKQLSKKMVFAD